MEYYAALAETGMNWLSGRSETLAVALAALTFVWLIWPPRAVSVVALIFLAASAVLFYRGTADATVAILLLSSSLLLCAIDVWLMRRQLKRFEHALATALQSVRALEIAEERRQGMIARKMLPRLPSPLQSRSEPNEFMRTGAPSRMDAGDKPINGAYMGQG
jgi:hypothetical protein